MKKQNENIQLHIISEDYKGKKKEQNNTFSISEKAISVSELQDQNSVFERLNKMHEEFEETKEPDNQVEDQVIDQIDQFDSSKLVRSSDASNLLEFYEKLKKEESELIGCKQEFLATEQRLLARLNQEINRKTKSIEELRSEISALQSTCREIEQELDMSTN
jgi:hypothetical protein